MWHLGWQKNVYCPLKHEQGWNNNRLPRKHQLAVLGWQPWSHWPQELPSFSPSCCWASGAQVLSPVTDLYDSDGKHDEGNLMDVKTPNFTFFRFGSTVRCSAGVLQSSSANISTESNGAEQMLRRRPAVTCSLSVVKCYKTTSCSSLIE